MRALLLAVMIALCGAPRPSAAAAEGGGPPPAIALFRAAGFPTIDGPPIPDQVLAQALAGMDVVPIERLKEARVLVLPYGSAFPLESWPNIRDFLRHGGSLVVLGGSPFEQPALRGANGTWQLGVRSPAYARELPIGPAEA